jgi:AP-1-like factor
LTSETENIHLKELLKRLRDENVSLRNTSFTFSVPRNGEPSDRPFNEVAPSFDSPPESSIFASTSHIPSPSSSVPTKAVVTPQSSSSLDTPSAFPADIDFGALTPLDPSAMDLLDDSDADAIMSYDFGYGQFVPSKTPYKTIASNPRFMSFADPTSPDTTISKSSVQSPGDNPYDLTFGQWTGQTSAQEGNVQTGSLDELFGGNIFGSQSPINFSVLMKSPATSPITAAASALSPVIHQSIHTLSTGPSSNNSPFESSEGSSPAPGPIHNKECPKTRAQMEQRIQTEGSSVFAPPPPPPPAPAPPQAQENEDRSQVFRAPAGADGPMIICKDATFPMTEKSDNNVEVLTAWRNITSHPHFKASVSGAISPNGLPAHSVQ